MARTWPSRNEAEREFLSYRDEAHIPLIRYDITTDRWTTVDQKWLDQALHELATFQAARAFPNG